MGNVDQFATQVERGKKEVLRMIARGKMDLAKKVFVRLVQLTPVDTGYARSSWMIGLGGATDEALPEGTGGGRRAATTFARQQLPNLQGLLANPFEKVSIFNNAPYIQALEEGHSSQAPNGMVAITLAELQAGASVEWGDFGTVEVSL